MRDCKTCVTLLLLAVFCAVVSIVCFIIWWLMFVGGGAGGGKVLHVKLYIAFDSWTDELENKFLHELC